jgi:hypothetical protein
VCVCVCVWIHVPNHIWGAEDHIQN